MSGDMSERLRQRFGTAAGADAAPAEQAAPLPTLTTSATVRTPLVQPALVELHQSEGAEAEEYQAFGQEHPETDGTIELRFGEEECWVLFRHFLKRVEASGDGLLTLICTDSVVTISGIAPVQWTPMMLSHEVFHGCQNAPPVCAGVPAPDGRVGPGRA